MQYYNQDVATWCKEIEEKNLKNLIFVSNPEGLNSVEVWIKAHRNSLATCQLLIAF
jgi:hypothetical protein